MGYHDFIPENRSTAKEFIKIQVETASDEPRDGRYVYADMENNIWYYAGLEYEWNTRVSAFPVFNRGTSMLYAADVYARNKRSKCLIIEFEDSDASDVVPRWGVLVLRRGDEDELSEAETPTISRA